jgi:dihydrolipoamide dehydrogenase
MPGPGESPRFDLVVIGAGPGGYVAAIRAAQLGMRVACVEKAGALGGTCLRIGCIPSKALLDSSELYAQARSHLAAHGVKVGSVELDLGAMMRRKDKVVKGLTGGVASLFKKNGVTHLSGDARIVAPGEVAVSGAGGAGGGAVRAAHILIATGSEPTPLRGIPFDGTHVVSSTEALAFERVPERLVVVGAGAVGLELGSVWARLGAEVQVVELLDRIVPTADGEMGKALQRSLERQGLAFHLGAKVTAASVGPRQAREESAEGGQSAQGRQRQSEQAAQSGQGAQGGRGARNAQDTGSGGDTRTAQGGCVELTIAADGAAPSAIAADKVLVAVGRRPYTAGLGLADVGVEVDAQGRVVVDEAFKTSVDGIYAIGDVIRGPMLAHKAQEEGIACVERLAGQAGHVNYDAIPSVVYTWPELATVGKSEEECREAGIETRIGMFPFMANGRARCMEERDGLVKIIANARSDRVLGVHILGPRASDMIAEAALAIEFGASAEDLARTSHAHPTLPEAVREAALDACGRVIHR